MYFLKTRSANDHLVLIEYSIPDDVVNKEQILVTFLDLEKAWYDLETSYITRHLWY